MSEGILRFFRAWYGHESECLPAGLCAGVFGWLVSGDALCLLSGTLGGLVGALGMLAIRRLDGDA